MMQSRQIQPNLEFNNRSKQINKLFILFFIIKNKTYKKINYKMKTIITIKDEDYPEKGYTLIWASTGGKK